MSLSQRMERERSRRACFHVSLASDGDGMLVMRWAPNYSNTARVVAASHPPSAPSVCRLRYAEAERTIDMLLP